LRFFTEATANILASLPALDVRFTGDLGAFDQVAQVLKSIPQTIESQEKELDLDEIAEDLYTEVLVDDNYAANGQKKEKDKEKGDDEEDVADGVDLQFTKIKNKFFKIQGELNSFVAKNNLKAAAKKAKDIWNIAVKIKNKLLAMYYESKFNTLTTRAKA